MTALWTLVSGMSKATLANAIPPDCRRDVATAPRRDGDQGDETLVESPTWPAAGAAHFVPSFCALTVADYSVRLELSARVHGAWAPWVAGVTLGPDVFAPLAPSDALDVDVDVYRARAPVEAVRVRARVRGPAAGAVLATPWLLTLSAAGSGAPSPATPPADAAARLDVPALSQMDAEPSIASRICSPTCVAMVLGYWGRPAPPAELAAEIFHPGVDLYGVWPAAIRAAGRRGVAGYLLRFPDWAAATWCLGRGLPVIASVRYKAGELTGAAIAETAGHLLVLTGVAGDEVQVNDPAAPASSVARRYRVEELARVWLERSGVGYVLFPPA
jgi:hypothetical protein